MKKILSLFLFLSVAVAGFSQKTDAELKTQVNTEIKQKTYSPARMGAVLDSLIDNKVNNQDAGGGGVYNGNSPSTVTVGPITAGTALTGKTNTELWEMLLAPYVNPVFNSFQVGGQGNIDVERGTTISGSLPATWSITQNSGIVSTVTLVDVTASTNKLTNTPNDGSESFTATTVQLNTNGQTQVWRMVGNNSNPTGTFNSSTVTRTGWNYRFYGAASTLPTNSAGVRGLPSNGPHKGAGSFTIVTGTTLKHLVFAVPTGTTITLIQDTTNNQNLTTDYHNTGTISVNDAGGTGRTYDLWELALDDPYPQTANHVVTTSN